MKVYVVIILTLASFGLAKASEVFLAPVDLDGGLSAWVQDIELLRIEHQSNYVEVDTDSLFVQALLRFEASYPTKNYVVLKPSIQKRPNRGLASVGCDPTDFFCEDPNGTSVYEEAAAEPAVEEENMDYPQENNDLVRYNECVAEGMSREDCAQSLLPPIPEERPAQAMDAYNDCVASRDPLDCNHLHPDWQGPTAPAAEAQPGGWHYPDPVDPNVEVTNWDTCMQAYQNSSLCGYWGFDPNNPDAEYDPTQVGRVDPNAVPEGTIDPSAEITPGVNPNAEVPPGEEAPIATGPRKPSEEVFNRCERSYSRAAPICGSDMNDPDRNAVQNFLRTQAGPTMMTVANLLSQFSAMNAASSAQDTQGMLNACKRAQRVATGMTALNGAWAGGCALMRRQCEDSCVEYIDAATIYRRSGDVSPEDFDDVTEKFQRARRLAYQCRTNGPMTQSTRAGIMGGAQSAVLMSQSRLCVEQLEALGPCSGPDAHTKPECSDYCGRPENAGSPACATIAGIDCTDPSQARSNPACICQQNPNDPACTGGLNPMPTGNNTNNGGRTGYGTPSGTGGSTSFASSTTGYGPASGPGGPGARNRNGGNQNAKVESFNGSGGSGPAGGGGGGATGFGSGTNPGATGIALKTDIMGGTTGGGLGRRRGGSGRLGRVVRGRRAGANNQNQQNQGVDLASFLPGGAGYAQYQKQRGLAGNMTIKARDGITGPYGPSLFDKVSRRYRIKERTLTP